MTEAIIDQVILGKLVPANSKILLTGISRGGFLSLVVAGRRPEVVKGENAARRRFQGEQFITSAKRARVPTMWSYGARDGFYSEAVTRGWFRTFSEAGGHGNYVFVADHTLPNGHNIANQLTLWEGHVASFLAALDESR